MSSTPHRMVFLSTLIVQLFGGKIRNVLSSEDSSYGSAFYLISFDENFIHGTEYELRLDIEDQSGNHWASLIHPSIESGLIVFDHFQLTFQIV